MGNKAGYARAVLAVLGLRAGQGADRYVWCEPDDGCRALLDAYTRPDVLREAATIIRGWKDEEPRALWERLRAEGPIREGGPADVARWARIVSGNRLTPDHHDGDQWTNPGDGGSTFGGAAFATPIGRLSRAFEELAGSADAAEVARWTVTQGWGTTGYWCGPDRAGPCGDHPAGWTGSITLDGIRRKLAGTLWPAATVEANAYNVAPIPGAVVYIDPPYQGTTGYGTDLPRVDVLDLARRWAAAGAVVCISEAEPLPLDGWHHVEITGCRKGQKRTFSRQQAEWLTLNRAPAWTPADQLGLFG